MTNLETAYLLANEFIDGTVDGSVKLEPFIKMDDYELIEIDKHEIADYYGALFDWFWYICKRDQDFCAYYDLNVTPAAQKRTVRENNVLCERIIKAHGLATKGVTV